jgi:hypothetical protein
MNILARAFIALLLLCGLSGPLEAKGQLTRIIIQREAGTTPVEIRDGEVLRRFNPWGGLGAWSEGIEQTNGFIVDWNSGATAGPSNSRELYDLRFYAKRSDSQREQLVYSVTYAYEPEKGQDAVYLPGKDDARYAVNVRSIFRGVEGRWYRPTFDWQSLARTLIAQISRQ